MHSALHHGDLDAPSLLESSYALALTRDYSLSDADVRYQSDLRLLR